MKQETKNEIIALLQRRYTDRAIAKVLGCSIYAVRQVRDPDGTKAAKARDRARSRNNKLKKLRKPVRCPECGGMTWYWPCLACHPEAGESKAADVKMGIKVATL